MDRPPWRWWLLGVVIAAEVMDLVDTTVMTVAAPSVQRDLGGGPALLQWLTASYTLAFGVLLVVGGRLGDRYGRRRLFLVGAVGFTAASAACALAPGATLLVAARLAQGGFGALMIPQGLGVLTAVFDDEERPTAFGTFGPVMGLSAVAGPVVAGVLTSLDWRFVFLINLPVGLAVIAGALRWMPRDAPDPAVRLDWLGAALVAAGCGLLVHPLIQGPESGWPAWSFALLAGAAVALVGFAWRQRRAAHPIVVPSLLRSRTYVAGLGTVVVFTSGMGGLMLVYGLHLQLDLGASPLVAGLGTAPVALGIAVSAVATPVLTRRLGRSVLLLGLGVEALGALGLAAVAAAAGGVPALAGPALVVGLGLGAVFGPLFSTVLSGLRPDEVGSASGSLEAVQQIGTAVGVAVLGTVYLTTTGSAGLAAAALVVAVLAVPAALCVLALPAGNSTTTPQEALA
ncbi:MFS transporter [Actinomycetospora atypica]|uniref:MFS transporter n=1 Tax=Actinomycetospora atypica TaxID=1290095 RepID=A0ABV9YKW0_9PSEU